MERIEFRNSPDGNVYFQKDNDNEKKLTKFSKEVIEPMADIISERFPESWILLKKSYKSKYEMVSRFIRCNFGENDLLTKDFDNGVLNFEEIKCPLRGGFCPFENKICKPKSRIGLSIKEKEIVRLYVQGMTYDKIAFELHKSPSTVKVQLYRIKNRLKLKSSREIISQIRKKNLI